MDIHNETTLLPSKCTQLAEKHSLQDGYDGWLRNLSLGTPQEEELASIEIMDSMQSNDPMESFHYRTVEVIRYSGSEIGFINKRITTTEVRCERLILSHYPYREPMWLISGIVEKLVEEALQHHKEYITIWVENWNKPLIAALEEANFYLEFPGKEKARMLYQIKTNIWAKFE